MDNPTQEIPQPQPVQPKTQPQQPTNNSSWLKAFSIGFGVVGIGLIIGIGGYLLGTRNTKSNIVKSATPTLTQISPTPSDKTANWQIARTDFYEIKYPTDAYKQSSITGLKSLNEISLISVNDTNQENGLQDVFPITIKTTSKTKIVFTDPKHLFGQVGPTSYDNNIYINNREPQDFALNGNKGYILYEIGAGISGIEREIILIKGDYVFDIQVENSYTKDTARYKNLVDQILSTFKFTKQ